MAEEGVLEGAADVSRNFTENYFDNPPYSEDTNAKLRLH